MNEKTTNDRVNSLPINNLPEAYTAANNKLKKASEREEQQQQQQQQHVHFLSHEQLAHNDAFSASWIQQKSDFMTMALDKIDTCEDAAFVAFEYANEEKSPDVVNREPLLRMTADFLDFRYEGLDFY